MCAGGAWATDETVSEERGTAKHSEPRDGHVRDIPALDFDDACVADE
jgi:hypothetical protein